MVGTSSCLSLFVVFWALYALFYLACFGVDIWSHFHSPGAANTALSFVNLVRALRGLVMGGLTLGTLFLLEVLDRRKRDWCFGTAFSSRSSHGDECAGGRPNISSSIASAVCLGNLVHETPKVLWMMFIVQFLICAILVCISLSVTFVDFILIATGVSSTVVHQLLQHSSFRFWNDLLGRYMWIAAELCVNGWNSPRRWQTYVHLVAICLGLVPLTSVTCQFPARTHSVVAISGWLIWTGGVFFGKLAIWWCCFLLCKRVIRYFGQLHAPETVRE